MHDLHVEYEWSLADECTASRASAYDYAATCCPNCRQPRRGIAAGQPYYITRIHIGGTLKPVENLDATRLFISVLGARHSAP